MSWWVGVVFVVAVGVALDRALLAIEARGHINWRKTSARGAAGTALMSLQEFMEPQAAALVEQQRDDEERQDVDDADDAHRPRL